MGRRPARRTASAASSNSATAAGCRITLSLIPNRRGGMTGGHEQQGEREGRAVVIELWLFHGIFMM
jgi:hypothetical protein